MSTDALLHFYLNVFQTRCHRQSNLRLCLHSEKNSKFNIKFLDHPPFLVKPFWFYESHLHHAAFSEYSQVDVEGGYDRIEENS